MDKFTIRLIGKKDRNGNEYFTTVTKLPVLINLQNTVFHFFPFNLDDGKFGAELNIKHYEPGKTFDNDSEGEDEGGLDLLQSNTLSDEGY